MPLDALQTEIATLALSLPTARRVVLVGGAAMLAYGLVDRPTYDLDLFSPNVEDVRALTYALADALTVRGFDVRTERESESFVRIVATAQDGRSLAIDIAQDARMRPPVRLAIGAVVHLDELAADKVLALFDRAEPRDLVDVDALAHRYERADLLDLALEKDAGFQMAIFRRALRFAASADDGRFAALGLGPAEIDALRRRANAWADDLSTD